MRAALDPNGADAYWAGRFGLIPLGGIHKKSGCLYRAPTHPNRPVLCSPESPGVRGMARDQKLGCGGRLSRGCGLHFFLLCRFVY